MIRKFTNEQIKYLKYYVYIYMDPDTKEIFYIGKGKNNRVFSHLFDTTENEKTKKIKQIRERGKEPDIEVLIHGLEDEETALKVEAAVIDLIGVKGLTNVQKGHQSKMFGRIAIDKLIQRYNNEVAEIEEPSILIRINKLFRYGMSQQELYDATRGHWKVGIDKDKVQLAFAVYNGIVQEVYKVAAWFEAGTTYMGERTLEREGRWEFVGRIANEEIRHKYLNKSAAHYFKKGAINPFVYVNIKEK